MTKLDRLLQQKMNRRQFLAVLGTGAVSLLGFSAAMGMLTKDESPERLTGPGYGRADYGP